MKENSDMPLKEPTNRDLLNELKSINKVIDRHDRDIATLLGWKIAVEAVDRYQATQNRRDNNPDKLENPIDWTKIVIGALGIAGSAIAVIAVMAGK